MTFTLKFEQLLSQPTALNYSDNFSEKSSVLKKTF